MEKKEAWIWFLQLLAEDVDIVNQHKSTLMSDKQKELVPAFQKVFPNSHHKFYVRHFYTNFINLFKGKTLKDDL